MKMLNCANCDKPMGEIEKGRLKKDLRYICQACLTSLFFKTQQKPQKTNDFMSQFSDLLGGRNG